MLGFIVSAIVYTAASRTRDNLASFYKIQVASNQAPALALCLDQPVRSKTRQWRCKHAIEFQERFFDLIS